jgi:hypothetical protein
MSAKVKGRRSPIGATFWTEVVLGSLRQSHASGKPRGDRIVMSRRISVSIRTDRVSSEVGSGYLTRMSRVALCRINRSMMDADQRKVYHEERFAEEPEMGPGGGIGVVKGHVM